MSGYPIQESLEHFHRNDPTFFYDGDPEVDAAVAEEEDYIESLVRLVPPTDHRSTNS